MTRLRIFSAPLRRFAADASGQAIVTYAIVACLFAAALVMGTYAWKRDSAPPEGPAIERNR